MRRVLPLGTALALALAGCGSGDDESKANQSNDDQTIVATQSDAEVPDWLSPTEPMDTGRWLASREEGRIVANDDGASVQMRRSLGRAQSFFIEDPRMIANRTVQLGEMLGSADKPERYEALMEGLTRVAQGARGRQLYGEMCQHYYNTRRQGSDREAALATLSERYGAQGSDERAGQTDAKGPLTDDPERKR